jgi:hypothetical protein
MLNSRRSTAHWSELFASITALFRSVKATSEVASVGGRRTTRRFGTSIYVND